MMQIYPYENVEKSKLFFRGVTESGVRDTVSEILRTVRDGGDTALRDYARRFDKAELTEIEVPARDLDAALETIDPALRRVMEQAAENIRTFHAHQCRTGFEFTRRDGVILGQKITPIEKVGLYIPGGTAVYPSTVLMNAIPAKLAGCSQIVMVSPPTCGGGIAPVILAAAKIAGVDRVFQTGGAQAIAALAYGTETVPKVDKIVGPGNAFVAEAKRQVFGLVNIDMIAGPSEILVVADGAADPAWVAADLLSQAEHDKMATAVLVTDSPALAEGVQAEVERQLGRLPRQEIARASIDENGKIILASDLAVAIEIANELAPEHLELCIADPMQYLPQIRNAGSVFLGRYCPEALGDYMAGPNHTLPTSGTARFSSPLSVDDFIKKTQYTYFTQDALAALCGDVATLARAEGLEAHARSSLIRSGEVEK